MAYSWDSKTVIRAGAGIYYGANIATNFQYPGPPFYKSAPIYFSKDFYQTQYATLENPFPGGTARLLRETSTASWRSGDSATPATLVTRPIATRRSTSGVPESSGCCPSDIVISRRLLREPQHAPVVGQFRNRYQKSELHSVQHSNKITRPTN